MLFSRVSDLPPDDVQAQYIGKSGEAALVEAERFVAALQAAFAKYNDKPIAECRVLDFGCGWGRMALFVSQIVRAGNLYCSDVQANAIDHASRAVPAATFIKNDTKPPMPLPDSTFDLIYAYSVFSHLSEELATAWVVEFARLLRPGGVAAITTRPREHIDRGLLWSAVAENPAPGEREHLLDQYDIGEFVYVPSRFSSMGGGEAYGDAAIPAGYAARHWSDHLRFCEMKTAYGKGLYLQPLLILQR